MPQNSYCVIKSTKNFSVWQIKSADFYKEENIEKTHMRISHCGGKNMKKKTIALILAAMMSSIALTACGKPAVDTSSDLAVIKDKGKMVIGITEYQPMNYYDENGELTGFDTEFAKMACAKLGVEPVFQIIDWDTKETELKSGNIDCIWNGLTVTEDRKANMDFTEAYLTNKQCVVINSANSDTYTDIASLSSAMIQAEAGSAGETAIKSAPELASSTYTGAASQADALLALKAGNCDAIVIDYTMANASCGTGDYADLCIVKDIEMAGELYAIGFRTGSDVTPEMNTIIKGLQDDGSLRSLAEKYELTELYDATVK